MKLPRHDEFKFQLAASGDEIEIQSLIFRVLKEYGLEPEPDGEDLDIQDLQKSFFIRGGIFCKITNSKNEIVGTFGMYPMEKTNDTPKKKVVELRKMYFDKSLRGKGLGKCSMEFCLRWAKENGYNEVLLTTAKPLKEAISLYKKFGFQEIDSDHLPCRCDFAYSLKI